MKFGVFWLPIHEFRKKGNFGLFLGAQNPIQSLRKSPKCLYTSCRAWIPLQVCLMEFAEFEWSFGRILECKLQFGRSTAERGEEQRDGRCLLTVGGDGGKTCYTSSSWEASADEFQQEVATPTTVTRPFIPCHHHRFTSFTSLHRCHLLLGRQQTSPPSQLLCSIPSTQSFGLISSTSYINSHPSSSTPAASLHRLQPRRRRLGKVCHGGEVGSRHGKVEFWEATRVLRRGESFGLAPGRLLAARWSAGVSPPRAAACAN